ncbi:MAG: hypothetical protein Fur003_2250 [Candidatus Dojkabacteria bacterium]
MSNKKKKKWWLREQEMRRNVRRFRHRVKRKGRHYMIDKDISDSRIRERRQKKRKIKNWEQHIAPSNFSLANNTKETFRYFATLKEDLRVGKACFVDVSEITDITIETLTLLCAFISDRNSTFGTQVRGNLPKDLKLKNMFISSGFLKHVVTSPSLRKSAMSETSNRLVHVQTDTKADAKIVSEVYKPALKLLYGQNTSGMHKDLGKILVEMMANTVNHASDGTQNEKYNWWFLVYLDEKNLAAKFCFLDLGVGIFDSLPVTIKQKYLIMKYKESNIENLKAIFAGEYKTKTAKKERGRGLFTIHETVGNAIDIKNFSMISNDIFAIIEKGRGDKIARMNSDFHGTIYYWELIKK